MINPKTPLGTLYLQHAIKAGMALNEAKHRIEELKEDTQTEKLTELARIAARHSSICEAILATAHELLDGDAFTALCRETELEREFVDEALANIHSDLPNIS